MTNTEKALEKARREWNEYNNGCFNSLETTLEFITDTVKMVEEEAYARGYKQGRFDKEMDDTYNPTPVK